MLQITANNKNVFEVEQSDSGFRLGTNEVVSDIKMLANGMYSMLIDGTSYTAIVEKVDRKNKEMVIRVNGQAHTLAIKEPIDQLLANMGLDLKAMQKAEPVKAPMPGMILKVLVEVGQQVNKGDGLLVLEAMKMENIIKAAGPGKVKGIKAVEKTAVEKGAVLIEME